MSVDPKKCINLSAEQLQISREESILEKLAVARDQISQSHILVDGIHKRPQVPPSTNFQNQAEITVSDIIKELEAIKRLLSQTTSSKQQSLPYYHSEKPTLPDIPPERRNSLHPQKSEGTTNS